MMCMLLSADMIPVKVLSIKKAVKMALKGKHIIAETHDVVYRSEKIEFPIPKVLISREYVKLPAHFYGKARYSDRDLRIRDKWTCQYCGKTKLKPNEKWTRDHIMPESRGGDTSWENLVLACQTCNNKKGDLTPEEAGMKLLSTPKAPTRWELDIIKHVKTR